jgi:translocation and assembly module TamB
MKRHWITLSCLLLLCLVLAASLTWLLGTTEGARWAFKESTYLSGVTIEADEIQGYLWDRLELRNLRIKWASCDITVSKLKLRWYLWLLINGKIAVRDLDIEDITIHEKYPATRPYSFSWPVGPRALSWLQGWVSNLRADTVNIISLDGKPVTFRRLSAAVNWYYGILQAKGLRTEYEGEAVTGSGEMSFDGPLLNGSFKISRGQKGGLLNEASLDEVSLDVKLLDKGKDVAAGPIKVGLRLHRGQEFHLDGTIALHSGKIELSKSNVTEKSRQGTVATTATLDFADPEKNSLSLTFNDLNLTRDSGLPGLFSGVLTFHGTPASYRGRLNISHKGGEKWAPVTLNGSCKGNLDGMQVVVEKGTILQGSLTGNLSVRWVREPGLGGMIHARGLNPGIVAGELPGSVNADLSGEVRFGKSGKVEASGKVTLLESRVRNRPLRGGIDGSWENDSLVLTRFDLQGDGFDIAGKGALREKLDFALHVQDLGLFVPGIKGRFEAVGWGRWRDEKLSGSLTGTGQQISREDLRASSMRLQVALGTDKSVTGRVQARDLAYRTFRVASVQASVEGTTENHQLNAETAWSGGTLKLSLRGHYKDGLWGGTISTVEAKDSLGTWFMAKATAFNVSPKEILLGPLALSSNAGEQVEAYLRFLQEQEEGLVEAVWLNLNLGRLKPFTPLSDLSGRASGRLRVGWLQGAVSKIDASADMSGLLSHGKTKITVPKARGLMKWDKEGLITTADLDLSTAGTCTATFSSSELPRPGLPETARFAVSWKDMDLALLQPVLPSSLTPQGGLSGTIEGLLERGKTFSLAGSTNLSYGALLWKTEEGSFSTKLKKAETRFTWKGDTLRGDLDLGLAEYGSMKGSFVIPLPARLPVILDRKGAVAFSLDGALREIGLLSAFFPGLVRENKGQADINISTSGTWDKPHLSGTLRLSHAGAYLLAAGIRIDDVGADIELNDDTILLKSLRAASGKGRITGKALARLSSWKVTALEGSLTGKDFEVVHLPELVVNVNPDLQIKGAPGNLSVTGDIAVTDASLLRERPSGLVSPSPDAKIIDAPVQVRKAVPFKVDVRVSVTLGDRVTVKAEGIEATLGGKVMIEGTSIDDIRARGEIKVLKGQYAVYGIKLDVEQGRVVFPGGALDGASLDIRALRKSGDVRAGVVVTGPFRSPLIKLYSEPSMPDTDILSYVMLGQALTPDTPQAGSALLFQAAGSILSKGQASVLQGKLQQYFGLDTLQVQQSKNTAGLTQSLMTVGKYISPRLYVSFGRSLFTDESLVAARLTLSKHWELESRTGTESGAVLYYKIEFE